jgi:hypothetical protein
MAKESLKAREIKRAKMVAKYAAKRAELKKIMKGDDYEAKKLPISHFRNYPRTLTRSACTTAAS